MFYFVVRKIRATGEIIGPSSFQKLFQRANDRIIRKNVTSFFSLEEHVCHVGSKQYETALGFLNFSLAA